MSGLRIACHSIYLPSDSKIGSGYQAHGLAQALSDAGNEVVMFSPAPPVDGARYDHRQVEAGPPMRLLRWAGRTSKLDLSGFDVFHSHGEDYLVGKRNPLHVRTMHGSGIDEMLRVPRLKEKARMAFLAVTEVAASARASVVVAVSQATRRRYPWIREVIPCGVDLDRFKPGGAREPVPTILFVGTYRNRKRGWMVQKAFQEVVRPALPDARLWMVCSDAPPADGVEVLGRLSDDELADRYRRAWVFCLPSAYEGFGVPYVEALASGLPVVTTPNLGALEVLRGGALGQLAAPSDLGRTLIRSLTRPTAPTEQALRAAAETYSWRTVSVQYVRRYCASMASTT